jgi:UDP:flavonoid glycosyltransferase YjiC (YdhE family)
VGTAPELTNFLSLGEAPIYIGFGSMTGFDNERLLEALINVMRGRRALFNPGWSRIDIKRLPNNFFAIADTPHDWLSRVLPLWFITVAPALHTPLHGRAYLP